jgi:hypothetical protein
VAFLCDGAFFVAAVAAGVAGPTGGAFPAIERMDVG